MLQNTLHMQSLSYNANTNTPPLSESNRDSVALYEVTTAGKLSGVSIQGAQVGADSYLLVGDVVQAYNGVYKLLSREVKSGTTITVGTGGLFATLESANSYINQRSYVDLTVDILSPLTETVTYSLSNNCSGNLLIKGNGHLIDFTGGARLEISGLNIHLSNFKVKASHATEPALYIQSDVTFDTALDATNTLAGLGIYLNVCDLSQKSDSTGGSFGVPSVGNIFTSSAGGSGLAGDTFSISCRSYSGSPIFISANSTAMIFDVTANIASSTGSVMRIGAITGNVVTGNMSTSYFTGAITGNVTLGHNSNSTFAFAGAILGKVIVGREARAYFAIQKIESSVAGDVLNTGVQSIVELNNTAIVCTVSGGTVTTGTGSQVVLTGTVGDVTNPINVATGVNSTFNCNGVITGNVLTGTGSTVTITQPITGNVATGINSYFYSLAITGNVTTGSTSTAFITGAVTGNISTGVNSTFSFNSLTSPILGQVTVGKDSKVYIAAQKIESSVAGNVLNCSQNSIVELNATPIVCTVAGGTVGIGSGSQVLATSTIGDATNPINVTTSINSRFYFGGIITGNVLTGANSLVFGSASVIGNIITGSNSIFSNPSTITGNITTGINSTSTFASIIGNLYFSRQSKVSVGNSISVPAGGSVDFEQQVNLHLSNATITLGAGVTNTAGHLNVVQHNNWAGVSAAAKTAFNYTAGVLSSAASGSNLSNL